MWNVEGVTYLDGASRSPMPRSVYECGTSALAKKLQPWTMEATPMDVIKSRFARLCTMDGTVGVTPSTSFAISAIAKNLEGKVLVLQDQMSSNVLAWQPVRVVPYRDDWTRAVIDAIEPGSILACPHVHWVDGAKLDLHQISKRCRDARVPLVVDATQSLGAMPLDVDGPLARLDFLCASTHKWLLGPYGCSLLFAGPERSLDVFEPLVYDEHNLKNVVAFGPQGYVQEYHAGAMTLSGGGRPNPVILPMVAEGLRCVLEDLGGPVALAQHTQPILTRAVTHARNLGFWVPSTLGPHMCGIRLRPPPDSSSWAEDSAQHLRQHHNVHTTGRRGAIRIGFGAYNNVSDADTLADGLADLPRA